MLDDLRTALKEEAPAAWRWPITEPDTIKAPAVLLIPTELTRSESGRRGVAMTTSVDVWVLTPHADPFAADRHLTGLVANLLAAMETVPSVTWSKAKRGVYREKFHGWQINATVAHTLTEIPTT